MPSGLTSGPAWAARGALGTAAEGLPHGGPVDVLGALDLGQTEPRDQLAPLGRAAAVGLGLGLTGRGSPEGHDQADGRHREGSGETP